MPPTREQGRQDRQIPWLRTRSSWVSSGRIISQRKGGYKSEVRSQKSEVIAGSVCDHRAVRRARRLGVPDRDGGRFGWRDVRDVVTIVGRVVAVVGNLIGVAR